VVSFRQLVSFRENADNCASATFGLAVVNSAVAKKLNAYSIAAKKSRSPFTIT